MLGLAERLRTLARAVQDRRAPQHWQHGITLAWHTELIVLETHNRRVILEVARGAGALELTYKLLPR